MIVHKSNVLTRLSSQQIIDIYTGKVRNWEQVGGHDQIITVVNKAEGRSTLELFLHYFKLKNSQINAQVVVGDNQQGMKTVSANPSAIGYVSIGAAEYEERNGAPIKRLPLENHPATVDNVAKGQYPLSRELNLVVEGEPSILAKRFIDFAQSAKVKDLIKEQFFVAP
jgi:phosphate transport system substrate-binding protein